MNAQELNHQESLRILDELKDAGCLFLCLTGGDIFCRKDLIPLLQAAVARGFALRLLTNGTMLTEALADALAEIRPLSIEISLYAIDPGIHDAITTVPGSHKRTMAAIDMCLSRRLNVAIKTVLLQLNANEFPALRAFSEKNGTRFVHDLLLAPSDCGANIMNLFGLQKKELIDFFRKYGQPPTKKHAPAQRPAPDEALCGQAANTLAISPTGDVFPCLAIRKPMGNLREQTLQEIWTSSELVSCAARRYIDLQKCGACGVFDACIRCPGLAWAECGDMTECSAAAHKVAHAFDCAWKDHQETEP